jgi:hypothetical protein
MDNIQSTFNHLKRRLPSMEVGGDFENVVFAKIKKKKRQRKITASVTAVVVLVGFLFIGQAVIFNNPSRSKQPLLAGKMVPAQQKEEIPVIEDVVFASSDSGSDYVIEQVGYNPDDGTL